MPIRPPLPVWRFGIPVVASDPSSQIGGRYRSP
jgi:hypothetical protein